jgi:hypothetical protein
MAAFGLGPWLAGLSADIARGVARGNPELGNDDIPATPEQLAAMPQGDAAREAYSARDAAVKESLPEWYGGGQGLGLAASMFAPIPGLGQGGQVAVRQAVRPLARAVLPAGIAKTATKLSPVVANLGIQGAEWGGAQGLGQGLSAGHEGMELAGDALKGAATGATINAALPIVGNALPSKQAVVDYLKRKAGDRAIKAAGAIQSDITRTEKVVGREGLNKIGQEFNEKGLVGPLSGPATVGRRAEALMEAAGNQMDSVLKQADALAIKAPGNVKPDILDVLSRAEREIYSPLASDPLQASAASTVRGILDGYLNKYAAANQASLGFSELHQIRRSIDRKLFGLRGVQDPGATEIKAALREFRGIVNEELGAKLEAIQAPAGWKAANRDYQVAATAEKFADKGMDRAHGNNIVSLTELMAGLTAAAGAGGPAGLATGLGTALVRRRGSAMSAYGMNKAANALEGSGAGQFSNVAQTIGARGAISRFAAPSAGMGQPAFAAVPSPQQLAQQDPVVGEAYQKGGSLSAAATFYSEAQKRPDEILSWLNEGSRP